MGAVFLLYLLYPFIIIIGAILLGAVIISLIVFINNMKNGADNKWPTKNIVGAIISGIIFTIFVVSWVHLTPSQLVLQLLIHLQAKPLLL